MSTHWRKKVKSTLAIICIIVLLIVIIGLWIGVNNGAFSTHSKNAFSGNNNSNKRDESLNSANNHNKANNDIARINVHFDHASKEISQPTLPNKNNDKIPLHINTIPSNNHNGVSSTTESILFEEFIKPSKVHTQPLHAEDLLYESQKFDSITDQQGKVPDHKITGQFRNKFSRIWDPHPQYLIDAFGMHLHLILYQDSNFIAKDMQVTHISHNETIRHKEDIIEHESLKGCYYKGRIRGDEHSIVSVSLCDGMRGHIYTSFGSYFIQPVEKYTADNPNILHKITRERIIDDEILPIITSKCDVNTNNDEDNNDDLTTITGDIMSFNETASSSSFSNHVNDGYRRIRRSTPNNLITYNAYSMEVLIAVDKKMQEYHGDNMKAYILTLMSIVSSVYADASIGNSINIAVVHLLLLKDDLNIESNHIGVSASQMLSGFCKFIQHHQFHHDTALLLTREQICRSANEMKCDTLGLAELGTMCRPSSCAIVQDNGLSAAFTIAHELGHVLSMPHDDDAKCQKFRNPGTIQQNIMSRMLDHNTHPWSWSDCSRHFVTEYLENNHGSCMLDKPKHDMIDPILSEHKFAGEKFSANQQCELVFGPESKVCSYMPTCGRLWCGSDVEGCRTQHMPWADGTECATNKWCQRGKCVTRNRTALQRVDGGWGQWTHFSACSRKCGGGIQFATRECNSPAPTNSGKYCIGNRIKYKSCNTENCQYNTLDFREKQCAELNNNNFGIPGLGDSVKWVPKYGASPADECKLYCRVEKSNNYFLLNEKVIDGTSCTHDSFNKCVNGICRPAGCDNELSSNATLDKCGVCLGNNDTCIDIHGSFTSRQIEESKNYSSTPYYYHVTRIPKGASNIEIIQKGYLDDLNYIALTDDQGEYILNGYNVITQYPRTFPYGGVTFEYTGTNTTVERVSTSFARRLKRDLIVEILSRSDRYLTSDLLLYSYTVSLNDTTSSVSTYFHPYRNNTVSHHSQVVHHQQSTHNHHGHRMHHDNNNSMIYRWIMSEWSECDKYCDGKRFRTAACLHISTNTKVSLAYCQQSKPMDEYEVCNMDCEIIWEVSSSECSHQCGEGVRTLSYRCVQRIIETNATHPIDSAHCPLTSQPILSEKCMGACRSAEWAYDEWGQCSRTCGGGNKSRTAYCVSHANGYIIDDHYCAHIPKENLVQLCSTENCPVWSYGENTTCSVTCGEGFYSTAIYCKYKQEIVDRSICSNLPQLVDIVNKCTMEPCHNDDDVNNHDNDDQKANGQLPTLHADEVLPTTLDNSDFNELNSTTSMTSTVAPTLFRYKWRTGRWGSCSTSCGSGFSRRSVICVNSTQGALDQVDNNYCNEEEPINVTPCENRKCPIWETGDWGECDTNCGRKRTAICRDGPNEIEESRCSLLTKPATYEQCCSFKWGYIWTPCSSSCGFGTRKRQQVCKRLFPKSQKNPYPRKKGQVVSKTLCGHIREPIYHPKEKKCKRQCTMPKWDISAWSKCSAGCGQGYSTREVKCTLGRDTLNDSDCNPALKPIKIRHCEANTDCKWKIGPWKNCSCSGYTKRKVSCVDTRLNKLSTSCSERDKPFVKNKCEPPPNCSCKDIRLRMGKHIDGEYDLNVKGRKIRIYCYNMHTNNPLEYLTLKGDYRENYSSYYGKRSKDSNQCPTTRSGEYFDKTIPSGITYYAKVRINLSNLHIIEDDFRFTRTTGNRPQTYGSAGDCYSNTAQCPQGHFSINFEGTKFRISPKVQWETRGKNSTMIFNTKLERPYQKVVATCGGYCGSCTPSKVTMLQLEVQ